MTHQFTYESVTASTLQTIQEHLTQGDKVKSMELKQQCVDWAYGALTTWRTITRPMVATGEGYSIRQKQLDEFCVLIEAARL